LRTTPSVILRRGPSVHAVDRSEDRSHARNNVPVRKAGADRDTSITATDTATQRRDTNCCSDHVPAAVTVTVCRTTHNTRRHEHIENKSEAAVRVHVRVRVDTGGICGGGDGGRAGGRAGLEWLTV